MNRFRILIVALLFAPAARAEQLTLNLPEPRWELDASFEPLREREAGLPPEEEETARQLRPLIAAGDYPRAIALLEQGERDSFSPALNFVLAQLYLAEGDFERAGEAYRATLAQMPDFLRAHRGLGVIYLQQDDLDKARSHLGRALALGANDAQIYGQLAYLNLKDGKPYSAVGGYRQALFLDPDNPQWQQGLLHALSRSGDYAPARALLEQLLQRDPDDPALWLQYSNLALRAEDNLAALSGLEMAIRLGESDADKLSLAGQLHLQAGSAARGVELLRLALEREPDSYPALSGIIDWLLQSGNEERAGVLVEAAAKRLDALDEPRQSALLTQQARIGLAAGADQRARERLERALALDPANGTALLTLAGILEEDNPAHAESLYARAAALPAWRENALLAHARLAARQRQYAAALELLEQAARESPDRGDIAHNLSVLQRLLEQQKASDLRNRDSR